MKVTNVEVSSIWTWYGVDVEEDSDGEESYTVCDMYDINSDSHEYEITPEPASEKDKSLLLEAIMNIEVTEKHVNSDGKNTSTFENWLPGE